MRERTRYGTEYVVYPRNRGTKRPNTNANSAREEFERQTGYNIACPEVLES